MLDLSRARDTPQRRRPGWVQSRVPLVGNDIVVVVVCGEAGGMQQDRERAARQIDGLAVGDGVQMGRPIFREPSPKDGLPIVDSEAGPAVYVAVGEGDQAVAKLRPLRLGRSGATKAEVIEGLKVGERVVVAGQFALSDGARVQVEAD